MFRFILLHFFTILSLPVTFYILRHAAPSFLHLLLCGGVGVKPCCNACVGYSAEYRKRLIQCGRFILNCSLFFFNKEDENQDFLCLVYRFSSPLFDLTKITICTFSLCFPEENLSCFFTTAVAQAV